MRKYNHEIHTDYAKGGACMNPTAKELRRSTGLSQARFAALLGIPKRSIENWESQKSCCPDYVLKLIEYYLKHEGYLKDI